MSKVIGIDLGTTNSVVSILENDNVKVIQNNVGGLTTPSVVAFSEKEVLVGNRAKNQAVTNPKNTITSVKRLMGLRSKDISSKNLSYKLVGKDEEPVKIEIDGNLFSPQEISAKILKDLKKSAEDYLGSEVTEAVITVPAYFNDNQRQATKDAGKIAGLTVKRIINEPTAAALAFGFKETGKEETIAVFDLGGGTFDISILEIGGGVLEVKSTAGDTHLGGDDFDNAIIDHVSEEFLKLHKIDLRKDLVSLQRLKEASEKAKCELSTSLTATINLPFISEKDKQPLNLKIDISRIRFESLIKEHLKRIERCCRQAISDSKIAVEKINHVVLVGGSSRIPAAQDLIRKIFGKEPNKSVNPDEVVSRGAAIQGSILSGELKENKMILVDVTPLSLGIETIDDRMDVLIPRNTTIPTSIEELYTTTEDGQDSVDINIFQGESKFINKNKSLGNFRLDGIQKARMGVARIKVTFAIDSNGILTVSANDIATNKKQQVTVANSFALNETEIKDLQSKGLEDDSKEAKFEASLTIKAVEKLLTTSEVDKDKLEQIQNLTDTLFEAMRTSDPESIIDANEDLRAILASL